MGGGDSKPKKNKAVTSNKLRGYDAQREEFKSLSEKSDILAPFGILETLDEISRSKPEEMQEIIDSTYTNNNIEDKMKKEEYQDFIYNHVGADIIKKQFLRPQYEIFTEFNKNIFPVLFAENKKDNDNKPDMLFKKLEANKSDNKSDKLKKAAEKALKAFEMQFNQEMLSIIYEINETDLKNFRQIYLAVNRNLKFNEEFRPSILNLVLNPALLNDVDFIVDLCIMIIFNNKLNIVSIIIDTKGEITNFNLRNLAVITKLMRAVSINNNIRGLFIQCISNNISVTLPEEANTFLLNKITSETLAALHLGRINLCQDVFKNIMYHLSGTKSLLYFGYDNENVLKYLREETFTESIQNNTSLQAISLSGFFMNNERHKERIDQFTKEVKEKNKEIKLIYCGSKSLVCYPFNKDEVLKVLTESDGYNFAY